MKIVEALQLTDFENASRAQERLIDAHTWGQCSRPLDCWTDTIEAMEHVFAVDRLAREWFLTEENNERLFSEWRHRILEWVDSDTYWAFCDWQAKRRYATESLA